MTELLTLLLLAAGLGWIAIGFVQHRRATARQTSKTPPSAGAHQPPPLRSDNTPPATPPLPDRAQWPLMTITPAPAAQPNTATRRRRQERASNGVNVGDGVGFELGIVGESNYMSALRAIAKRRIKEGAAVEFIATLQLEPGNPYDPNAVVVMSDFGEKIGYLSRGDALDYGPALTAIAAAGNPAQCRAKLVGGTREKKNLGVWLDIDDPDELLARVTNAQPF